MISGLELAAVDGYLRLYEQASMKHSNTGMLRASTELLKYFHIRPDEFTTICPFDRYFQSIIPFIRTYEPAPDGISNPELFYRLSVCHLALCDTFRAYSYTSRVPRPDNPEVCFQICFYSFALGRDEHALQFLAKSE
jgi:hypothetical protein